MASNDDFDLFTKRSGRKKGRHEESNASHSGDQSDQRAAFLGQQSHHLGLQRQKAQERRQEKLRQEMAETLGSTAVSAKRPSRAGGALTIQESSGNSKQRRRKKRRDKRAQTDAADATLRFDPNAPVTSRRACGCQARGGEGHEMVAMCTQCGYVVCGAEARSSPSQRAPCLFCCALIDALSGDTIVSDDMAFAHAELGPLGTGEGRLATEVAVVHKVKQEAAKDALRRRDELLLFQQTRAQRTAVHDTQSDVIADAHSVWASEEDRKRHQREAKQLISRLEYEEGDAPHQISFALGPQGEVVVVEHDESQTKDVRKRMHRMLEGREADDDVVAVISDVPAADQKTSEYFRRHNMSDHAKKVYDHIQRAIDPSYGDTGDTSDRTSDRTSDHVDDHMGDHETVCLSMHQPWASLLVRGIKRMEGRQWPCDHRGRLFIHAAAHVPSPAEIMEVEAEYRKVYAPAKVAFPETYPVSRLLGCVTVTETLRGAEFNQRQRERQCRELSSSEYVMLCREPRVLPDDDDVFRLSGQHKFWHLPPHVCKHALRRLQPAPQTLLSDNNAKPDTATTKKQPAAAKEGEKSLKKKKKKTRRGKNKSQRNNKDKSGSSTAAAAPTDETLDEPLW
ncbi:MAG: hypothetical protein MHM6MM_001998 [Cercozoa sp. M6MM]